MKKSNQILWGALAGLFGVCVFFLIVVRLMLGGNGASADQPVHRSSDGVFEVDITGVTGIDLRGHWQAEVVQGPQEKIVVHGPDDLLSSLTVRASGGSLVLEMDKNRREKRRLRVSATLPVLNTLRTRGVVDISLSGFEADRLTINADGVTSLVASKGHVDILNLHGRGVLKMDLKGLLVRQADIDCEGVIKVNLTMDGGPLTGSVKGVGELRVAGETSRMSIRQKGACRVVRENRV